MIMIIVMVLIIVGSLDEDGRRVLFSGRSIYNRQIYVVLVDPADVIDYTVDHDDLTFTDVANAPEFNNDALPSAASSSTKTITASSAAPSLSSSILSDHDGNARNNNNNTSMISSMSVEELASRAPPGSLDDEDMQILRSSINNSINGHNNSSSSSGDDKPIYMLHFGDDMCQTRVQVYHHFSNIIPHIICVIINQYIISRIYQRYYHH